MQRRNILKAAAAAGALPAVGGIAGARGIDDVDVQECGQQACIHSVLGYVGFSQGAAEELPSRLQPDHEVDLRIGPRGDPMNDDGDDDQDDGGDDDGGDDDQDDIGGGSIPEFFFEPTGLHVEQGDVVQFNFASPDHTVTAYHPELGRQRRVPEGVPAFSSPVLAGETFWLYRFNEPGVYDLVCSPHEYFGMVMRIVVDEPGDGFGDPSEELRPPVLTSELVLGDDALQPQTIVDSGSVSWTEIADENKRVLVEFPEQDDDGDDTDNSDDSGGD